MTHRSMLTRTVAAVSLAFLAACGQSDKIDEPVTVGGAPAMRRLSEDQYRHIIADVFGEDLVVGGRFDAPMRSNGLLAVGSSTMSVTPSAFERYDDLARSIAAQVVDKKHRDELVPCKPANENEADDKCAGQFFSKVGRLLYRRPLTSKELAGEVAVSGASAKTFGNFYSGLAFGLVAMLETPEFLFVSDHIEADADQKGAYKLSALSKAARLSFFLWNTGPDNALITAAEKGELDTRKGLEKQVDRMVASPRLEAGVRAFFSDMLSLDDIDTLQKDSQIYPAFGATSAEDSREQTLRTLTDLLVTKHGDYRDIFTTRETFINGPLGLLYQVPVNDPSGWSPYTFAKAEYPERVGIQSQVAFLAAHSHPGRSSATIRGRAIREVLLCQKVPDPPGNVDFSLVTDVHSATLKTARERLKAHAAAPTCAGCHRLTDPIGLAMEHFDGDGEFRTVENGAPIDTTGSLDGIAYNDAGGLGTALHDSATASSCLVNRIYSFAAGHTPGKGEAAWVAYLNKYFSDNGYKIPELMRRIAVSNALYAVSAGKQGAAPDRASNDDIVKEKRS